MAEDLGTFVEQLVGKSLRNASLVFHQMREELDPAESGQQQRIGWLEAAWPFASLNLPGPYLPLDTDSLSRGAAAAGLQLPSSL